MLTVVRTIDRNTGRIQTKREPILKERVNASQKKARLLTKVCTRRAEDDCEKECGEKDSQSKTRDQLEVRVQEDSKEGKVEVLMLTSRCGPA